MLSGSASTGLSHIFENSFRHQPGFQLYIASYLDLIKQNNAHFDEAQISLAEQNLWAEFYRECLQAMGEVSFDGLAILDNQGKILGLNKRAERTIKCSADQLVGQSVFEKLFSQSEARTHFQCLQEGLKDPNTDLFSRHWELVLKRPNGSLFPIELRLNRLKIFGSSALIASFNDITKQKWTFEALHFNEERYRKIISENADAICLIDPQTRRITEANTAFNLLLGYNREELLSLTVYDLFEGETQKIDEWLDFRRFRGTEFLTLEHIRLMNKLNQWIEAEVSCSVFEQRNQHVVCIIVRDTAERKILKRPRIMLEKLQKTGLVEALSDISLLLEKLVPVKHQQAQFLELHTLHQHVCDLIEAALPVQHPEVESDQSVLPQQPFSLRAIVNSLKFLFHHTVQSRGLHLFHSVEEDVPDLFWGESGRLQHILYHLLDNALRHTEAGNITVTVRMAEQTDEAASILFMVRDNGRGISEELQPKIKQVFEHGTDGAPIGFKGIVLIKEYVDDLKGRIWFNSLPGQGTTFLFSVNFLFSEEEPQHLPDFDPEIPPPDWVSAATVTELSTPEIKIKRAKAPPSEVTPEPAQLSLPSEEASLQDSEQNSEIVLPEPESSVQPAPEPVLPTRNQVRVSAEMAPHAPGFLEKRRQDLLRIEQALGQSDFDLIRVLGKSMKNAGRIFGFVAISEMGEDFELGASEGNVRHLMATLDALRNYLDVIEIVVEA